MSSALSDKIAPKERKTRFCFAEIHDTILLREVLGENGIFQSNNSMSKSQIWQNIAQNINQSGVHVDAHRAKLRLHRLVEIYNHEIGLSGNGNGVQHSDKAGKVEAIDMSEKKALLQRFCELRDQMPRDSRQSRNVTEKKSFEEPPVLCGAKARKTRFCFTDEHDIVLLKEVLKQHSMDPSNGFQSQQLWSSIAQCVYKKGVHVNGHRARLRIQRLVDTHEQGRGLDLEDGEVSEKNRLVSQYCKVLMEKNAYGDASKRRKHSHEFSHSDKSEDRIEFVVEDERETELDSSIQNRLQSQILELMVSQIAHQKEIFKLKRKKSERDIDFQEQMLDLQTKSLEMQSKILQILSQMSSHMQ